MRFFVLLLVIAAGTTLGIYLHRWIDTPRWDTSALNFVSRTCQANPDPSRVKEIATFNEQFDASETKLEGIYWNNAAWLRNRLELRRKRVQSDQQLMHDNCVWGDSDAAALVLERDEQAVVRLNARVMELRRQSTINKAETLAHR